MNKLIGLLLVIVALLLPFAANNAFDSIPRAVWYTSGAMLVVGLILLKLKYRSPRAARSRNVFASSLAELADGIEDKSLSIDPTTKAILKDLYATLDEISTQLTDGETQAADETIQDVMYDIERAVYPNGMSEKQSAAPSRRKPKRRTTHILIFALCAASAISASAEWQLEKHTDEMTDAVSFILVCPGEPVNQGTMHAYIPKLIVEITPKEYNTLTQEASSLINARFSIENNRINGEYVATVRFDKNQAEDWDFSESSTSRSGYLDRPNEFSNRLKKSSRVLLRFRLWGGEYITLNFDVTGYRKAIDKMYARIAAEKIASVKYTRKPKCSKCGGTGEIVTWKRCTRCYGSGTSSGAPCPKCRTSTRKGYIRHAAPCATCHGQ